MSVLNDLLKQKKADLVNHIFNDHLSMFADYKWQLEKFCKDDKEYQHLRDPRGWGKRLPYIGWFWRTADFVGLKIPIGKCRGEDGRRGFRGHHGQQQVGL